MIRLIDNGFPFHLITYLVILLLISLLRPFYFITSITVAHSNSRNSYEKIVLTSLKINKSFKFTKYTDIICCMYFYFSILIISSPFFSLSRSLSASVLFIFLLFCISIRYFKYLYICQSNSLFNGYINFITCCVFLVYITF